MAGCSLFATLIILLLAATLCYGQYPFVCPRATYYGSPDCLGNPSGACGFGEYGRTVYNGEVSGVSRLFRHGIGCGACYQVRCTIPAHCSDEGTTIVVTDYGEGHNTDFVLSPRAYAKLATPGMDKELFSYGVVDIEYKRVPCHYDHPLTIMVHERSNYPHYLAIVPLYNGGISDIISIDICHVDCKEEWSPMRRVYGTVFDTQCVPKAPLIFRLRLAAEQSGEEKLVQTPSAIPAEWEVGVSYNTSIQLN